MEYLAVIGGILLIHALAMISPGPDLIMAIKNSLTYSLKVGVWTAVGFGLGVSVHIGYCVLGLAWIISQSIVLFNIIKYLGAGYLVYIGIKSFFTKKTSMNISKDTETHLTPLQAVWTGFLTNVLNPKVTLYFLSLFTFVISPDTPNAVIATASTLMIVSTVAWFSLVAVLFAHKRVRTAYEKFEAIISRTFGAILVAFGIKVALSRN